MWEIAQALIDAAFCIRIFIHAEQHEIKVTAKVQESWLIIISHITD